MDHVNNAVYADWLDEAVLAAGGAGAAARAIPRLARLEYARAAEPGATSVARVWPDGGLGLPGRRCRRDPAPAGAARSGTRRT